MIYFITNIAIPLVVLGIMVYVVYHQYGEMQRKYLAKKAN